MNDLEEGSVSANCQPFEKNEILNQMTFHEIILQEKDCLYLPKGLSVC